MEWAYSKFEAARLPLAVVGYPTSMSRAAAALPNLLVLLVVAVPHESVTPPASPPAGRAGANLGALLGTIYTYVTMPTDNNTTNFHHLEPPRTTPLLDSAPFVS